MNYIVKELKVNLCPLTGNVIPACPESFQMKDSRRGGNDKNQEFRIMANKLQINFKHKKFKGKEN